MQNNTAQESFNSLLTQYYNAWFRFHPEKAVHVGVNGYEEKLTPFDDEEIGALVSLNRKILSSLDELNYSELSTSQQLDYIILNNAVNIELSDLQERDWRFFSPQKFLPLEAIHQLVNRPVENVHKALKHRLESIPEYLRSAKTFLGQQPENIPYSWAKDAIQACESGAEYFRGLLHNPAIIHKFQNPARLQPVCDAAANAVEDFGKYIRCDVLPLAKGEFACGTNHFNNLLSKWHGLNINAEELYAFGERLFKETLVELKELATNIDPEKDIESLLDDIRQQHPGKEGQSLMNAYRDRMQAAYSFVIDKDLVTVPEQQALKVVETPLFLRHEIPFAAYDEPSYKDEEQQGYYYVTPVKSDGHLLEHNWTSIDLTCVHEAFPGHHLQFVTANQNQENSLPRMLNASATFYEGWALYCEDLMQEQGFLDKPEHKFIMLRDRLWRALRITLDVELHTGGLDIDTAAQRMCDELGFDIDQAKADLSWYTQAPTVPMGYAVGWALIKALRDIESEKPGFTLKTFHDKLLSIGSCALPLVIKHAFGGDAWEAVSKKVFS